jgi:1-acyl-sn-glycerol-3-phosphate acyltransferase
MRIGSGFMRKVLEKLYGGWFLTVFSCVSLTTNVLILVVPGQAQRRRVARLGARLVFRLAGAWPAVQGMEFLPQGAAVVVANHASYLDGILLTAVLPHRYQFVIKREMMDVPGVHFFLRRIGAHFVERFDARKGASDARKIMQAALAGGSLAFFPEGTFRREPGLRRFQNGAFTIAARHRLPVVPLVIKGTRTMLPAESWLPKRATLEIHIQEPLHTTAVSDPAMAREHSRSSILAQLGEPDLGHAGLEPVPRRALG